MEINRLLATVEFPWDINQALSFALFRTYAQLTHNEVVGATNYYRQLGTLMGIKGIPANYTEFARFLDEYEATHFAYNAGARKVADSTLDLMTTFPPNDKAPKWLIDIFARSLMDDPLLNAFGCRHPARPVRALSPGALKARDLPNIRTYPGGAW
ncbi:oxygenase MpaB family protein [Nocardia sp. 348MFTsu5.1]|uniref:oxygenase MpaB family protein n=1 Tax=Nocardia sp. 348MFTsu5.1 TaxID=1172185 RepID=UPI00036DDD92|nr:oxygenase MpaB family protein [Nocardia sp. 348MFTsu5.1]